MLYTVSDQKKSTFNKTIDMRSFYKKDVSEKKPFNSGTIILTRLAKDESGFTTVTTRLFAYGGVFSGRI